MNNITLGDITYVPTDKKHPIPDGIWFQNIWYSPLEDFKDGDWVIVDSKVLNTYNNSKEFENKPVRILGASEYPFTDHYRVDIPFYSDTDFFVNVNKMYLRKANAVEILELLRATAKEKGFIAGVNVKMNSGNGPGKYDIRKLFSEKDEYVKSRDSYFKANIELYKNGKWIELAGPLFTTEDGVEICKGEKCWYALAKNSFKGGNFTLEYRECNGTAEKGKYFSSEAKAKEYIFKNNHNYEIVELLTNSFRGSTKVDVDILSFINNHPGTVGWTIHSVKRLSDGEIFTIGDNIEFLATGTGKLLRIEFESAPGDKGKGILSFVSDNNMIGKWWDIKDLRKTKDLFFGGEIVSFKVIPPDTKYFYKTVEISCKGEMGTHFQLEEILKNYFRPCKFGNVEVKSFTFKTHVHHKNASIQVFSEKETANKINKITIGCLAGTYKELVDIYNHCLILLK